MQAFDVQKTANETRLTIRGSLDINSAPALATDFDGSPVVLVSSLAAHTAGHGTALGDAQPVEAFWDRVNGW